MLGASFLSSMMFLSLVLIVAFEAGFHFVGSRVGVLKTALGEMGNKEILREQELSSLKKAKKFKNKSSDIDPYNELNIKGGHQSNNQGHKTAVSIPEMFAPKHAANTGYVPATAFAPITNFGYGLDPVGRVSQPLPTGSKSKSGEAKKHIKRTDFDALYEHVKQQVKSGKINLSVTNMRKVSHAYIKANIAIKNTSTSIPETGYLVDKIKDKMLDENFIIENPNYSNGKAKYLLVKSVTKKAEEEKKDK